MSETPTAASRVELDADDLPACCPNRKMPLWSGHPRVYLDLSHGEAHCPYCGTAYRLKPGVELPRH